MKKIRIVYWGTPDFSIPSLTAFHKNPRIEVLAVVTQPDKPVKRSATLVSPPVKQTAEKYSIPVLQPAKLGSTSFLKSLGAYEYNVVVAYGKLIPKVIINHPEKGSINLHPSILPKYRGPAPIHYALLHGDSNTAITIIKIDEEMDHGPILIQQMVPISDGDNYLTLLKKLSEVGAKVLVKTTVDYFDKKISETPQAHTKATYTKLLAKIDGELEWDSPQKVIYNKIRALNPWPGTYTYWKGKRLKILDAKQLTATMLSPGKIVFGNNMIHIGTRDGDMDIRLLQLEGKTPKKPSAFIRGNKRLNGVDLPT